MCVVHRFAIAAPSPRALPRLPAALPPHPVPAPARTLLAFTLASPCAQIPSLRFPKSVPRNARIKDYPSYDVRLPPPPPCAPLALVPAAWDPRVLSRQG